MKISVFLCIYVCDLKIYILKDECINYYLNIAMLNTLFFHNMNSTFKTQTSRLCKPVLTKAFAHSL